MLSRFNILGQHFSGGRCGDVYFQVFNEPSVYFFFAIIFSMSQARLCLVHQQARHHKVSNKDADHISLYIALHYNVSRNGKGGARVNFQLFENT